MKEKKEKTGGSVSKKTPSTSDNPAPCKRKHPSQRFLLKLSITIVLTLILGLMLFLLMKNFTKEKTDINTSLINSQLKFCQELVVGEYNYSDVIAIKKSAGLSKSYSIIKYGGIIRSGIEDVKDITYDVSENGREIVLRIPPAKLLGNEVTSQEIFDEKQSVFVRITTQEIFNEINEAKARVEDMLIARGLLDESWHHAAAIIEQFMYGLGFDEVVVKIK